MTSHTVLFSNYYKHSDGGVQINLSYYHRRVPVAPCVLFLFLQPNLASSRDLSRGTVNGNYKRQPGGVECDEFVRTRNTPLDEFLYNKT